MARIRTFIAVELSESVRQKVGDLQRKLAINGEGVHWVTKENFHLTLLFLGEVEQLEVVGVCRAVKACTQKHEPFTLEVTGVGGFPNMRRPKVLWAGFGEGIEEIKTLHSEIEKSLMNLGCYRREDRQFTPHLTLGRLTPEADDESWGKAIAQQAQWTGGSFTVSEIVVMASESRREGYVYTVMGRGALGE